MALEDTSMMSLKTAMFNPTVFNGSQYEYKPRDLSILKESLAKTEARQQEASKEANTLNAALSGIEKQLHNDEQAFFSSYKGNILKDIEDRKAIGDYGSLINYAITKPGEILSDSKILGRINANEKYTKFQEGLQAKRDKGELSDDDFNYLQQANKYYYEDKELDGNTIQGDSWKATRTPVKSLNVPELASIAFKLCTPEKSSKAGTTGGSSNVDKNGNILDITTGSKTSSSVQNEKVTLKRIRQQIDEVINTLPDGLASVEQAYDSFNWKINQMEDEYDKIEDKTSKEAKDIREKINQRKSLMYGIDNQDDKVISYKEFFARLITNDLVTKNLAYNWTFTESSSINDTIGTKSKKGEGGILENLFGGLVGGYTGPGENVEDINDNPTVSAAKEGEGIVDMVDD